MNQKYNPFFVIKVWLTNYTVCLSICFMFFLSIIFNTSNDNVKAIIYKMAYWYTACSYVNLSHFNEK